MQNPRASDGFKSFAVASMLPFLQQIPECRRTGHFLARNKQTLNLSDSIKDQLVELFRIQPRPDVMDCPSQFDRSYPRNRTDDPPAALA